MPLFLCFFKLFLRCGWSKCCIICSGTKSFPSCHLLGTTNSHLLLSLSPHVNLPSTPSLLFCAFPFYLSILFLSSPYSHISMAIVACQDLQSCLHESITLRLKLASPSRPHFSQSHEILSLKSSFLDFIPKEENTKKNNESSNPPAEKGGWSFLQSLSVEKTEKVETVYVHPTAKRSLCSLSEKSLELCTENLGNENGSDIKENIIFSFPFLWDICDTRLHIGCEKIGDNEMVHSPIKAQKKPRHFSRAKKETAKDFHFPPSLTSVSGSVSLRIKSYREDGRLVMRAVKIPSQGTIFHVERKNGRLQLTISKDYSNDTQLHVSSDNSTPRSFNLEEAIIKTSEGLEEEMEGDGNGAVEVGQFQGPS